MGPSRTRDAILLAQRGRFHEGSMKDRASAAPPLQFLDPSERVLMVPFCTTGTGTDAAAAVRGLGGGGGRGGAEENRRSSRMRTNIFGQMWEGVRGRLRIRRDADKDKGEGEGNDEDNDDDDDEQRPTRDQVLANYHQLVASGFFSSHAIQSTRHGPPPPRPCTSRGPPPQWPLAPAVPVPVPVPVPAMMPDDDDDDDDDKKMTGSASPRAEVCSPASAASSCRGTKRAAAGPPPGEAEGEGEADRDDEGEDEATRAHRFLPKRLRRTAPRDRDIISLPRLRGVASRNKGAHDAPAQVPMARRGPTDHDDMATSLGRKIKHPSRARTLRTRAAAGGSGSGRAATEAEPLSVVPDANRGIPRVPAIPAKFTYGEDGRENGGSTR